MTTLFKAIGCLVVFCAFFSCAKQEEEALTFGNEKLSNIYAIEAKTVSCEARMFVDPSADNSTVNYDVSSWFGEFDLGELTWDEEDTILSITMMKLEFVNSKCASLTYIVSDAALSCATLPFTWPYDPDGVPGTGTDQDDQITQAADLATSGPQVWKPMFAKNIGPHQVIRFPRRLLIGGMTPVLKSNQKVPNCTAVGQLKIQGVKSKCEGTIKYMPQTSLAYCDGKEYDDRNVRKVFSFSVIFQ